MKYSKVKFSLKFLAIAAIIVTACVAFQAPKHAMIGRSLWLYPKIYGFYYLLILSGPFLSGLYLVKPLGWIYVLSHMAGGIAIFGAWVSMIILGRAERQHLIIPLLCWLSLGGWSTYVYLTYNH